MSIAADDDVHTAKLTVKVSKFVKVLQASATKPDSQATIALADGQTEDHGVSIGTSSAGEQQIVVTKTVDLCFEMIPDDQGNKYNVVGLVFRPHVSPTATDQADDPDGLVAFPGYRVDVSGTGTDMVTTLTVRDDFDSEKGVSYDFLILIQRVSDAVFGVIDPLIVNQSS